MTTWRTLIAAAMEVRGDSWDNIIRVNIDGDLDTEFDEGWGSPEGAPFLVWTHDYVYFPIEYDGAEWAAGVRRHPGDGVQDHMGGG